MKKSAGSLYLSGTTIISGLWGRRYISNGHTVAGKSQGLALAVRYFSSELKSSGHRNSQFFGNGAAFPGGNGIEDVYCSVACLY